MNCLSPPSGDTCHCECTCKASRGKRGIRSSSVNQVQVEKDKTSRGKRQSWFTILKSIQHNLFGFDRNRNTYYSYTNKGGALVAKYSYKKLSQNESEFIPDECPEYKTPIIKTDHGSTTAEHEHTDDDIEEAVGLLSDTCDSRDLDTCTESCSESMSMMQSSSDTGTQYCSKDTDTEDIISNYQISVQYPLTLQEEDCDWDDEDVTCNVCDRSFPTPVHLDAHMVKYRHWLCNNCDKLFNSLIQLEYHKDTHGHWSDEYEIDSEDSDIDDINCVDSKTITHAIIEQETAFSCHGDKNILMCHQF